MSDTNEPEGLGPMWGIVLIGWFIVLGTLLVSWRAVDKARLSAASERFETTTGTVTISGIRERGGTDYRAAVVLVTYVVDGEEYELSVSGKGGLSEREPDPDTFVIEHPVGRELDVYYDPQSPSRAALIREIAWARDAVLAGCGVLLSAGFGFWGWRRRRETRSAAGAGPPAAEGSS
jgi:hypothetical protein